MKPRHAVSFGIAVVLAVASLAADTLVLRDGRRAEGRLVGMRSGVVEFEEDRGWRGSRTLRIDRDEVLRIELDEADSFDSARNDASDRPRPSGLREREVTVAADVPWSDAGIDVREGQAIYFEAQGRVNWGPGRRDGAGGQRSSPRNPTRPIPNRPGAALIGRVNSDDPFFIGDDKQAIRMRAAGRLSLGINDDYLADNSGSLRVTVYY